MLEKQIVGIIILVLLEHQLIQLQHDYTKGALDISRNPTKASNYLLMLPAIGYAVKAPLKRGVEVAMRIMLIIQKTQYIICIKQVLKSMLEYCLIYQLV